MGVTRIHLLGNFAVETSQQAERLPFFVQRVVAFLALSGPTHRSHVAGTLWPEVAEAQALASLRTSVWRARRMVPGVLVCKGQELGLEPTVVVDSREQEAFAMRLLHDDDDPGWVLATIPALRAGPLLPGWYDDWVIFERERVGQLRLHALETAARVLTRQGELESALDLALEAVRTEPLRETAHAALIAVFIAEGNVGDAVRQYDVFSRLLSRELGLAPSARLADLLPAQWRR